MSSQAVIIGGSEFTGGLGAMQEYPSFRAGAALYHELLNRLEPFKGNCTRVPGPDDGRRDRTHVLGAAALHRSVAETAGILLASWPSALAKGPCPAHRRTVRPGGLRSAEPGLPGGPWLALHLRPGRRSAARHLVQRPVPTPDPLTVPAVNQLATWVAEGRPGRRRPDPDPGAPSGPRRGRVARLLGAMQPGVPRREAATAFRDAGMTARADQISRR